MSWWNKFTNALRFRRKEIDSARRGFGFAAGSYVNEDVAMKVAGVHRALIYISTQIAKLPWNVKNRSQEILYDDKMYRLLNLRPNKEMNAFSFRLTMIQSALLHGNAYAEIERDAIGRPVALWPIASCDIELHRTRDGELVYRVIGMSAQFPGSDAYLPFNDVFHIKNFHTKDGLVGQGLLAYAMETIGISAGADRMASGLFANSGIPSGVLEIEGALSEEAYKRIKESWDSQHSGRRTGGTAVLEEGAKYKPITMSPEMLQMLESRQFGVLEICRFFGLPPTKLFDNKAATFNNMENANLEVATDTLDAWARNLEIEADTKLLSDQFGGKFTELDLYQVFRGDMNTRANYFSKMMQVGAITPNQIREREGLAGYKGGDRYYISTNNYTPSDRVDEVIDAQIAPTEKTVKDTQADADVKKAVVGFLTRK